MRLRICLIFAFIIVSTSVSFAQTLDQLRTRASQLWDLRKQANQLDALQLIAPDSRQIFLKAKEPPFIDFKVYGLEFTDEPNQIDVLVKVRGILVNVGEMDRMIRESWVWENGNWFMRAKPVPTLFDSDPKKPAEAPVAPEFKITNSVIDVGRHTQGDLVDGRIPFHGLRSQIAVIRPLQPVTGLSLGSAVWTSPSEGYIPYQWETLLLSKDVNQTVTLQATASNDTKVSHDVEFRARIDGKIGFKQVPEILDPSRGGQVELQIQNLSAKPLKILSVLSRNSAYVIDDDIPESIAPGKAGRVLIRYAPQLQPTGTSIGMVFSEQLGASATTAIPLNIKMPDGKAPSYSLEDLDRLRKTVSPNPQLPK